MTLTYRQVHWRYARKRLLQALQNWGWFLLIAAALLGPALPAAAVFVALPLFWSLSHPLWFAPILAACALLLASQIVLLKPLLWPAQWSQQRRSLPLPADLLLRIDSEIVLCCVLPLLLLLGSGLVLLMALPATDESPSAVAAGAGFMLLGLTSTGICVAVLRLLEALESTPGHRSKPEAEAEVNKPARHWFVDLMLSPLQRGYAPSTRRAIAAATATLLITLIPPLYHLGPPEGWLMLYSLLALFWLARIDKLSQFELKPILEQCKPLPLSLTHIEWSRRAVCAAPGIAALTAWLLWLLWLQTAPFRTPVLLSYVAVSLIAWVLQLQSRSLRDGDNAARLMTSLGIQLALASEVLP